MYSNTSLEATVLTLDPLDLSPSQTYLFFGLGLIAYCTILFWNLLILSIIASHRMLHKPMYLLLFNMPVNDMMGATAFLPHLIFSILSHNRSITFPACFSQALLLHTYASASVLILTAMAYDRYVAICSPLRYNSIMSQANVLKIIVGVWAVGFSLVFALLCMLFHFHFCRTNLEGLFCGNAVLIKLVCEDVRVSNYYALFITAVLQAASLLFVTFTYVQILITCLVNRQPDAKSKALQTCATHLVAFGVLQVGGFISIVSHRFEHFPPSFRKACAISVLLIPPMINPVIYGVKTKDIRDKIFFLKPKVSHAQTVNKRSGP